MSIKWTGNVRLRLDYTQIKCPIEEVKVTTNIDRINDMECGLCNLIRENDVSQEYVQKDFSDMHHLASDKSIWPNQCLPWLMLEVDERIKILKDSKVFCKIGLKLLGTGATSNSCSTGKHLETNGRNTVSYMTATPI